MMKHTLLTLFMFLSLLCHGQSYKFFTTDRELSSSLINKIYQDRNSMIWIATEDGLNRYDGAKFVIYKHDPETSTLSATTTYAPCMKTARDDCS